MVQHITRWSMFICIWASLISVDGIYTFRPHLEPPPFMYLTNVCTFQGAIPNAPVPNVQHGASTFWAPVFCPIHLLLIDNRNYLTELHCVISLGAVPLCLRYLPNLSRYQAVLAWVVGNPIYDKEGRKKKRETKTTMTASNRHFLACTK